MADRRLFVGLVLALSLVLLPGGAIAAGAKSSGEPGFTTDAEALLKRSVDFLARSPQYSVTIRAGFDVVQNSGRKIEFGEVRRVTLRRPDRFRSEVELSNGEKGLVLFDGKDIIIFSEKDKVFARASRPGDVDGAVKYILADLKMRLPLAMMYVSSLPQEIEKRVRSVDIVERPTIKNVPCAHLAAVSDDVDFQVWVPTQGDPLPIRIVITYKHEKGQPQFWADFSEWNLSPNPSDSLFLFSPSEGVREIPFLAQLEVAKPAVKGSAKQKGGKR